MPLHLGLGPVFKFECLAASRRWQYFAGRILFIGILLAALGLVVWNIEDTATTPSGLNAMAGAGEKFYLVLITTQLSMLFLVAPALAADAICLDKSRGALLPVLTTDLSSREIILGKLFARLLPILGFVICGLPVLAICFSMGGIHPEFVFGAFLVCLGVALVGGAGALALSVWCTKPYEVLLVCYLLWIGFLLLLPIGSMLPATTPTTWTKFSNPYYLCLAPYMQPGSVQTADFVYFFMGCVGFSVAVVLAAIAGLRGVILRQGSSPAKKVRPRLAMVTKRLRVPWFPRPSLDGNPVLWREWQRRHPSWWVRSAWSLYGLVALGFSVRSIFIAVYWHNWNQGELGPLVNAFQVSVGLLLVSVTSVTSLQEERVRGSMDVLLTTPLSTLQIFWGKWWGSFRTILLLTILPTLVAAGPYVEACWKQGNLITPLFYDDSRYFLLMPLLICCYGAAVVSVGLGLAIWIKGSGKATVTSVILYLIPTVGCILSVIFFRSGEDQRVLGSSFMATGFLTVVCVKQVHETFAVIPWLMFWSIGYTTVAGLTALWAYHSFDRCLERMPEKMTRFSRPERAVRRAWRTQAGL